MLDVKHQTVLNLLLDGQSIVDVSKATGISENLIARWISGDPTAGTVSVEFCEAYKKLRKTRDDETNKNLSQIRFKLSQRLREWTDNLRNPMSSEKLEYAIDIIKALKEPPSKIDITQIYNMQFQTPEDVVHEFKRLSSLAGDGTLSSNGRAVQGSKSGRPASIPLPPERRGRVKKKNSGDKLQPESEAGGIPSEPSQD